MLTLRDYRFELGAYLQEVGEEYDVLRSWNKKPFFYKLIEKYNWFDKFGLQDCHNMYLKYLDETKNGITPLYRYENNYSSSKKIIDWYQHKRILHDMESMHNERGMSYYHCEKIVRAKHQITDSVLSNAVSNCELILWSMPIVVGVLDA